MPHVGKLYFQPRLTAASDPDDSKPKIEVAEPTDEEITEFIANAKRPVRERTSKSLPGATCLYEIDTFEYIKEMLGNVFYNNQQRRRSAHVAIETYIRPRLDQASLSYDERQSLLVQLHNRVQQRELTYSYENGQSIPCQEAAYSSQAAQLMSTKGNTVENDILLPNGVSIAYAKPSQIIAKAKIIKEREINRDTGNKDLRSDHYLLSATEDTPLIPDVQDRIPYYKNELEKAGDANTIVLEVYDDREEEWRAAYAAAHALCTTSSGTKCIMLIPPLRIVKKNELDKKKMPDLQESELKKITSWIEGEKSTYVTNEKESDLENDLEFSIRPRPDPAQKLKERKLKKDKEFREEKEFREDRAQNARIKRPIKKKIINLESFDERKDVEKTPEEKAEDIKKKLRQLNSLARRGSAPIRLHEIEVDGAMVLHLGPKEPTQYIRESLWLFPAERDAMYDEIHHAIQRYIRPWLERHAKEAFPANVKPNMPEELENAENNPQPVDTNLPITELLDKLHHRVHAKRIQPQSFYGSKPKRATDKHDDGNVYSPDMRTTFNGMTAVPKGLSIAKIAPFKVMADIRIVTPKTHSVADAFLRTGPNASLPVEWMKKLIAEENNAEISKENYKKILNAYGHDKQTIVLEVHSATQSHWRAAYAAAKEWLASQASHSRPSIMLVPPYDSDTFIPSGDAKTDKEGWSNLMAELVGMNNLIT